MLMICAEIPSKWEELNSIIPHWKKVASLDGHQNFFLQSVKKSLEISNIDKPGSQGEEQEVEVEFMKYFGCAT